MLVFLDESAANERTGDRKFGWAPIGSECIVQRQLKRSKRWSILPALSIWGYMDFEIIHGGFTLELFLEFLRLKVLPKCGNYERRESMSVIVMDNASQHMNHRVRELVEDAGCELQYLPPYSPDFNPIELTFKDMKAWIKRNHARQMEYGNERFEEFLHEMVEEVAGRNALGLYGHCGYTTTWESEVWQL